ncbi:hypothetical protein V1511DRAFT_496368 [Dipodascopsis uninucleata]
MDSSDGSVYTPSCERTDGTSLTPPISKTTNESSKLTKCFNGRNYLRSGKKLRHQSDITVDDVLTIIGDTCPHKNSRFIYKLKRRSACSDCRELHAVIAEENNLRGRLIDAIEESTGGATSSIAAAEAFIEAKRLVAEDRSGRGSDLIYYLLRRDAKKSSWRMKERLVTVHCTDGTKKKISLARIFEEENIHRDAVLRLFVEEGSQIVDLDTQFDNKIRSSVHRVSRRTILTRFLRQSNRDLTSDFPSYNPHKSQSPRHKSRSPSSRYNRTHSSSAASSPRSRHYISAIPKRRSRFRSRSRGYSNETIRKGKMKEEPAFIVGKLEKPKYKKTRHRHLRIYRRSHRRFKIAKRRRFSRSSPYNRSRPTENDMSPVSA